MRVHLRQGDRIPDFRFVLWGTWDSARNPYRPERFVLIRLPSYGMAYDYATIEYVWSQRFLLWSTARGFEIMWKPV